MHDHRAWALRHCTVKGASCQTHGVASDVCRLHRPLTLNSRLIRWKSHEQQECLKAEERLRQRRCDANVAFPGELVAPERIFTITSGNSSCKVIHEVLQSHTRARAWRRSRRTHARDEGAAAAECTVGSHQLAFFWRSVVWIQQISFSNQPRS
jgi:hypothetical protein